MASSDFRFDVTVSLRRVRLAHKVIRRFEPALDLCLFLLLGFAGDALEAADRLMAIQLFAIVLPIAFKPILRHPADDRAVSALS